MSDMTPQTVTALFTRSDGQYLFARWGRPIVPVVFGVRDETLATIKGAVEAVVTLAGHRMAETDPEQGANLLMFFFRDWDELLAVLIRAAYDPVLPAMARDPSHALRLLARVGAADGGPAGT